MRHTRVLRSALGLSGLLLLAALVFAWRQGGPRPTTSPAVRAGPSTFARHCAACHDAGELAAPLSAAPSRAAAALDLLELLDGHGAAELEEDLEIVRELLEYEPVR